RSFGLSGGRTARYLLELGLSISSALSVTEAQTQGLDRIAGEWNNQSGWNMAVTLDDFGGWNAWLGCCGQGRITTATTSGGANIKLEGLNWECWYSASILSGGAAMNWRFIAGESQSCQTAVGRFNRVSTPGSCDELHGGNCGPYIANRDSVC